MKLRPGKRYTREQLREAMSQAEADELKLKGYVLQFDTVSETYAIVPWQDAAGGADFGQLRSPRQYAGNPDFGVIDPIKKRTPMERVNSLMLRLVEDCKATGTIPAVDDARIKLLVGENWKAGQRLTADDIRRVAANLLVRAEKEKQLADYKKVGDYSPTT